MIVLTECTIEQLREDSTFILYRAHPPTGHSQLALVPRQPTIGSLEKLENEYALVSELDPAFAVMPAQLVPHQENMMLLLDDPGGHPLSTVLRRPQKLIEQLHLALEISSAVGRLHANGLLHRDIKPHNFIVTEQAGVRLTGFGNAIQQSRRPLPADAIAGTLAYLAPEQTGRMNYSIDARSDLYAIGVTLYEIFAGVLPFSASTPEEWIHCHAVRAPRLLRECKPELPSQLCAIVHKLLEKDPLDRYQSADGLSADLGECLGQWTASARILEFSLGRYDGGASLQMSGALYGRESESALLIKAFSHVAESGKTSIVLISGPSGIGKSSLVANFQAKLAPGNALIAAGKYDLHTQDVPYAVLNQAFGSLFHQILAQGEDEIIAWRQLLSEAVGSDGQLIADLLPALELLLDPQPDISDLSPQDRLNRLRIVFRRLVGAFGRSGRPLVLFIDDLQWLDVATLDLLGDLVIRPGTSNLLLVGAYRTNEVSQSHPLTLQLKAIRTANILVEDITLEPLMPSDVVLLVAETLKSSRTRVRPLANLIYGKTAGNPFFTAQFMSSLHDEGLLEYDRDAGVWQWDMTRIRVRNLTDNVADLMVAKINLLPVGSRQILQTLASMGGAEELKFLAMASGLSLRALGMHLRPALRAGLLERRGNAYVFAHDRVREAAYDSGPIQDKLALNLRAGLALAQYTDAESTSERLYLVASQLNRGATVEISEADRETIIALNFLAGQRARSAAAYQAAIGYLQAAQDALGDEANPGVNARSFEISFLRTECELLVGHLDFAEEQLRVLSDLSPNIPINADVTRLRANLYVMQGRPARGVDVCLEFLRKVGIEWQAHPTDYDVDVEGSLLRKLVSELSDKQLSALPPMKDLQHLATMAVFADLVTPALLTDLNLSNIVILAAARLTLEHGIYEGSCYPLVCAFSVLRLRYADVAAGLRLAQFAISLTNRWPRLKMSGRTLMVFGQFVAPWVRPLRSGQVLVRRSQEIALATGDLTWASYADHALLSLRLFSGDNLRTVYEEAENGVRFAQASGFDLLAAHVATQRDLALVLINQIQEKQFEVPSSTSPVPMGGRSLQNACFHHLTTIQLNVLAGRYQQALALADEPLFKNVRAYLELAEYRFYTALAHAGAHDPSSSEDALRHSKELGRHQEELAKWREQIPENFSDRLVLLRAEMARIDGRIVEAAQLYEEAIHLARKSGFVQIEALAAERAAQFYEQRGIRTVVVTYLVIARDCYIRWGAHAKALDLERSNPHIPRADRIRNQVSDVRLQELDVNALFRASRALSGEIQFNGLIRTLMRIVIEHASAARGILFLIAKEGPRLAAEGRLGGSNIEVQIYEAGDSTQDFSRLALNYVCRTKESINSATPAGEGLLSADPYLRQREAIKVRCLPILKQTNLVGVLYLESHAGIGAFNTERAAVLDLLAAQAAISLENAQLYAELQRSEAFLAEGESISHTGSWSWNARTCGLLWSSEHFRIFGMASDEEEAPIIVRIFRMVHRGDRIRLRRQVQSSIREGNAFACEYRLIRSDGTRHLRVVGRPVSDDSGEVINYVGTTIDISDYRRTQEALQAARSDLARASRLATIGELSSLIAHEVRQPLTAIVSQAGACRAWLSHDPPEVQEAVSSAAKIAGAAHRASSVVESIRQMTRNSAPVREPLDINDVIKETVDLLQSEIHRGRVTFKLDLATGIQAVAGDRVQVQQVIVNLIINAIEAMAAMIDRPRFLWLSTATVAPGQVAVSVADAGIGLPEGEPDRMYEAFFTTKPSGLGVGLAICRSIVEAHGGLLTASPNQPHGSVFQFTLSVF
jgi:PAS domain S-box-containing protein